MRKQVKLSEVPIGTTFEVWDKKFTVLKQDDGKVFVLAAEFAARKQFREGDEAYSVAPNDFRDSSIKTYLNGEYIDELIDAGADLNRDIFPLVVDLKCTMGQHEYGTVVVWAGLLTLEQYGEFWGIIPLLEDEWCLATPWDTPRCSSYPYDIWHVNADGCCNSGHHSYFYKVRPALNLNPQLIVSVGNDTKSSSDNEDWDNYIIYLHKWAVEHSGVKYKGCSPACYDEWLSCGG